MREQIRWKKLLNQHFFAGTSQKMLNQQNSSIFPRNIPGVTTQNMRREIDFKLLYC